MKITSIFPFLKWTRQITRKTLKADLIAGFTGAIIVLPQGVAFASIAGLPPQYGLYTAMVTPIIAALFGSSRHLVSGPTTAISLVIFSAASHHVQPGTDEFIALVLTMTFLAGVYQLAFGLARLGSLVNFVSHTVVIGFTAGAAVLIVTSQMKHVLGLSIGKGESFLHTWTYIFQQINLVQISVITVAAATLITAILVKRFNRQLPNLLIALIVGSLVALFFTGNSDAIKMVGAIPATLPPLSSPEFSLKIIKSVASESLAIALLGLIEAVSISRSIATKSNQRIDSNQEFIGQGLSNIFGSFFSSYAGSGSFTRSGINHASGAKTQMSAIFAALFLILIVLLIAPLTQHLPVAAMGGVILIVAYKLIDFHHIKQIFRYSRSEAVILVVTFKATLFLELEFAIYLGVILSLMFFLSRTSTPDICTLSVDEDEKTGKRTFVNILTKPIKQCPQLKVIRIDMSIYFGSINHILDRLTEITDNERIYNILIVASGINFIDLTGAEALVIENKRLEQLGGGLYFVGLHSSIYEFAAKSCFVQKVGPNHFFDSKTLAIRSIYKILDRDVCATCQSLLYKECQE